MRKVLKSYMISFVKSWVETLGTIIFLLTLTAIVVGMLGAPLQIAITASTAKNNTEKFDTYLQTNTGDFEDDFIYEYFWNNSDKYKDILDHYTTSTRDGNESTEPKHDKYLSQAGIEYVNAQLNAAAKPNNFDTKDDELNQKSVVIDAISTIFDTFKKGPKFEIPNYKPSTSYADGANLYLKDSFFTELQNNYHYSIPNYVNHMVADKNKDLISIAYSPSLFATTTNPTNPSQNKSFEIREANASNESTVDGKKFGNLTITKGRNVSSANEVVISEKYATAHELKIGDKFNFEGTLPSKYDNPTIVGFGNKYDTLAPSSHFNQFAGNDITTFAYVYMQQDVIINIWNDVFNPANSSYAVTPSNLSLDFINRVSEKTNTITKNVFAINYLDSESVYKDSSNIFTSVDAYTTISALNNINVQVIIYAMLGVVILILSFLFINFVIKKELSQSRIQLGIFKAFGYRTSELSWIFALKTLISCMIGIVFGYILSMPLQLFVSTQFDMLIVFSFDHIYYGAAFMAVIFIVIPMLFTLISYFVTLKYLHESALALISNSNKVTRNSYFLKTVSWIIFPLGVIGTILKYSAESLKRRNKGFTWRLQQAFTQRGLGKFVMVITLFVISAILFTMQLTATGVMGQVVNQGFGAIKDSTDHRFGWSKHGGLTIKTNGEKRKFSIDNTEKFYWNKNFKFTDYSEKGIEKTIDKNAQNIATNISNVFDVVSYYASIHPEVFKLDLNGVTNAGTKDGTLSDIPALIKNNKDSFLFRLLFMPIAEKQTMADGIGPKLTNELANDIHNGKNIEGEDLQKFWNFGTDNENDTDIWGIATGLAMNGSLATLTSGEEYKQTAMALKDYTKLLCLATQIKPGGTPSTKANAINCGDPNSWSNITGAAKNKADMPTDPMAMMNMLSAPLKAIISSAAIASPDTNYNPLYTFNNLYFDKNKDLLTTEIPVLPEDGLNITAEEMILAKTKNNEYGDITNILNLSGVGKTEIDKLSDTSNIASQGIPVIISYRIAKIMNKGIGDTFKVTTDSKIKLDIPVKIVGINKADSFGAWLIADYDAFFKKYGDESLQGSEAKTPAFNAVWSQDPVLDGQIDYEDAMNSAMQLKFHAKSLAMSVIPNTYILPSLMIGINSKLDEFLNSLTNLASAPNGSISDRNIEVMTSTTFDTLFGKNSFMPYNMLRKTVTQVMGTVKTMMTIFMVLDAFLLLIILVVVMNIVVDEAARILLTLRAIGYRSMQVNWMVMGNYIIWAAIGFVFAYGMSILIWHIILDFIWTTWGVLIALPITWETPVISFVVLSVIMFIGWMAAMKQISKRPLTKITS